MGIAGVAIRVDGELLRVFLAVEEEGRPPRGEGGWAGAAACGGTMRGLGVARIGVCGTWAVVACAVFGVLGETLSNPKRFDAPTLLLLLLLMLVASMVRPPPTPALLFIVPCCWGAAPRVGVFA
jgi:hypothetical protein